MKRFYDDVDDLSIDVPAAHSLLEQLALKLYKERILSDSMLRALPSRYLCFKYKAAFYEPFSLHSTFSNVLYTYHLSYWSDLVFFITKVTVNTLVLKFMC